MDGWTPDKINERVMDAANADGFEYIGARMIAYAYEGEPRRNGSVWVIGLVEVSSRSRLPREDCLAPKGPDGKYPLHHPTRTRLVLTIVWTGCAYTRGAPAAIFCDIDASRKAYDAEVARSIRLRGPGGDGNPVRRAPSATCPTCRR